EPLQVPARDVGLVEAAPRNERSQQREHEIDIVGRLASVPAAAATDLARRAHGRGALSFVGRAQRLSRGGAEQGSREAVLLLDLLERDRVRVLLEQVGIGTNRAHSLPPMTASVRRATSKRTSGC